MTGQNTTDTHFLVWTPFAVLFNSDGDLLDIVGPSEGDPYSLLGPGDVFAFDPGDETEGEWTRNDPLSIDASVIAGRVAATYRALAHVASLDDEGLEPGTIAERITALAQVWATEALSEFTLRELSCDQIASIAAVVALIDPNAATWLLAQHAAAADSEWDDPQQCQCRPGDAFTNLQPDATEDSAAGQSAVTTLGPTESTRVP